MMIDQFLRPLTCHLMSAQVCTPTLLRLLGFMDSCIDTVPYGRLHMRPIQIYLLYFWRPHIDGLHFKIPVFPILATHLMWWQQERNIFRGVPLQGYPHNKVLWTDASKWGWGAHLGTHQVAGQWPKELINHHINWLETRAIPLLLPPH
jgi:hypothetical protein